MWKPVYVGKAKTKYEVNENGEVRNGESKYVLKPQENKNGYYEAHIYWKGHNHPLLINRLVALAFIPNPYNKKGVNNIEGNKHNNHVENLECCTREENMQHSWKIGLRHKMLGKDNPSTKTTEKVVRKICSLLENDTLTPTEISKKLNVSVKIVKSIKYGDSWQWITKEYKIPDSKHPDYSLKPIHSIIDSLLLKGFTGRKIRKMFKLNISKEKYKNLLSSRKKALKKKGKL